MGRIGAKENRTAAQGATTTRMGIYFHRATFDGAKSAYLADLDSRPDAPDSIARWIAEALDRHAALTTAQRRAATKALPEEERAEGSGFTRSFELPAATIAARDAAITTDRRNGHVTSRSAFSTDAIRRATEDSRVRAGGVLPTPPDRLPNRPVR